VKDIRTTGEDVESEERKEKEKPYPICSRQCVGDWGLVRHRAVKHKYHCEVCNQDCTNAPGLQSHMRSKHSDAKEDREEEEKEEITCKLCGRGGFHNRGNLGRHAKACEKKLGKRTSETEPSSPKVKQETELTLTCELCGKGGFHNKGNLGRHRGSMRCDVMREERERTEGKGKQKVKEDSPDGREVGQAHEVCEERGVPGRRERNEKRDKRRDRDSSILTSRHSSSSSSSSSSTVVLEHESNYSALIVTPDNTIYCCPMDAVMATPGGGI